MPTPDASRRSGAASFFVALGILLSRVAGLVRDRVFAHYFGSSDAADAFKAAFRIPNFLQNLFGEGVLSASFIPVYANLLARGDEKEANRVAGAIVAILSLVVSLLVLLGVLFTPLLIDAIAPGFQGEKRELTIRLVRVLFPGSGVLVLSAWCLGILNSHRRFFLSYAAPVGWNLVMIATMLSFGGSREQFPLAETLAWGSVAGSLLQLAVQLPVVLRLVRGLRLSLGTRIPGVRTVIRNFVPVFFGRGVVQISAYVDEVLGSLLPTGAVAALTYAQTLYVLPVSLFGMSVSAAELPLMSSAVGEETEVHEVLRGRLGPGLRRIAFFIVPSAVGFLALGDVIAAAIYQTGRFTRDDALYVWAVLAGATVGILASTLGRLYASTFYALRDTRTPLRCALVRVAAGTSAGFALSLYGPGLLGIEARWGAAGITLASGLAAWIELFMLRRRLNRRIGVTGLPGRFMAVLLLAALLSALAATVLRFGLPPLHPIPRAVALVGLFGCVYFGVARAFDLPELAPVTSRIGRLLRRRRS